MKDTTNPFETSNDANGGSRESGERLGDWMAGGRADIASPSSLSALFPPWLSSWMTNAPSLYDPPGQDDDDDSVYHDCLSNDDAMNDSPSSSSSLPDETTRLLVRTANHHDSPQGPISYQLVSPLAQAMATWLSPYADSARRAGKKVLFFSEEPTMDQESSLFADENSSSLGGHETGDGTANAVRFQADYKSTENGEMNPRSQRDSGLLNRSKSSPALLAMFPDERRTNAGERNATMNASTIVLKDIDVQVDSNHSEDGTVIHPWTKLIVLEELGTAWSWFVLLLPYAFMIVAVILDGDATLKNTTVGPLLGNLSCAGTIQGSVPTPFDESVKGYFPVPFPTSNGTALSGSCSYPFELRDGVGLLSRGKFSGSNSTSRLATERASIVDARYRYYMSHGHAFTSGLFADVPPTSQSLSGSVRFTNLTSSAVALVARGSVLVSAIVFQHQPPGGSSPSEMPWSPVLILSPKRLNMMCTLNGGRNEVEGEESTWNCSSRRLLNAYFSLPNAAVLTGEALRVDILLSHLKVYKSLKEDLWINERGGGFMGADDDYIIHDDINDDFVLSEAEIILSEADVSHHQELLKELSAKSRVEIEHESVLFYIVVEGTRIFSLTITMVFLCYWLWSMGRTSGATDSGTENEDNQMSTRCGIQALACKTIWSLLRRCCRRNNQHTSRFWWEDPWTFFPERRYLLLLLCCLVMLQNPLLVYAFFHPSLYSSPKFRFVADSSSGICVHGILFLWLCLVHGLSNAAKIEEAVEMATKLLKRPYGIVGYSQGCANELNFESKMISGTPAQQNAITSSESGLVCRQLLFSAANGSSHGPAAEAKVHQLITMCEDFFKYQQGYFSRAFISSTLEAVDSAFDSAAFQKFLGGAKSFLPDALRAFWREAQHLPHIPTCVIRGVLEQHTTPESLEMVCNLLTKQSGSSLHDSQVHVYDAVGHPVYVKNRNGRILKNTDMGGAIQRTHHWSPLSEEVEFVRTSRDVQQAIFDCAKDRHIFPFCDVNARFGIIRYMQESKENSK